ncbi:hypothetical protein HH310_07265 [Actinoplanes sp. TBRC 11911]|uniref:SitI3 family protein n=1 Tax=Actinoplanes sp. TBRC 11911 TaxID=2729386 RepID=UPI00145CCEA3|nr:SitI3 family protein [Actinoplanes sp. TBRC 11911]NMO50989.1 hypothetical protein [Actinoplanes sp. TBRC 11911]
MVLAGSTLADQVAERSLPDPAERPLGPGPLLSADLVGRYGFLLTVRAGQNGYVEVAADDGVWVWEPKEYVSVNFRLDSSADLQQPVINMLTVVRRILDTGAEDAALVFNADILLLTRLHGVLREHHRDSWWAHYPG